VGSVLATALSPDDKMELVASTADNNVATDDFGVHCRSDHA
jgi:hypothetical protein